MNLDLDRVALTKHLTPERVIDEDQKRAESRKPKHRQTMSQLMHGE